MPEYKFLCPKCGRLVEEMYELADAIVEFKVSPGRGGEPEYARVHESPPIYSGTTVCGACEGKTPKAGDILVAVDGDVVKPVGKYWVEHRDEFTQLVSKLGLKPGN